MKEAVLSACIKVHVKVHTLDTRASS